EEMASAIELALTMPAEEQIERIKLMRQQVKENNVYRWAGRMLVDAARSRRRERIVGVAAAFGSNGTSGEDKTPRLAIARKPAAAGR
ncbi:MAG: trehalose-6-phosphate synthase, partial [Bradyrhizobium sp.]